MRVLIVDDANHAEYTISENCELSNPKSLLRFYGKPHSEDFEIRKAYIGDIMYEFGEQHEDFDESECENIVLNMFQHLVEVDSEFMASFEEIWGMAE